MQLAVHDTGVGLRTVILIHGFMSDHRAWDRVGAELVEQGFRVLAVDLAGHGRSPRAPYYSPAAWADDVVETLEPMLTARPDLIMGHSLGGLVASLVAERLAPQAAIYVDPAFAPFRGILGALIKLGFKLAPRPPRFVTVPIIPKWSVAADFAVSSLRAWHSRTLFGFSDSQPIAPPLRLVAPSLVVLAEKSLLITDAVAAALRGQGMSVEVVPGSGHTVFRDEHEGFMSTIEGWLSRQPAAVAG